MKLRNTSILVVYVLLVGCAVGAMTAKEYRMTVLSHLENGGTRLETIEVNRPYIQVAELLKTKSEECLRARIHKSSCKNEHCTKWDAIYTPTIVSGPSRTEIHIQYRQEPEIIGGEHPKDGVYVLVADVIPNGNQGTKVSLYEFKASAFSHSGIAMKHWINGTNLGCPNLDRAGYE